MNLILCDDDKAFLDKLEIRIRGLCQKHKIAVEMECYVSAKEMLEGIKNLDEISVFFIDIDMPEVNGFEVASYLKKWNRECCIVFVSNKDDLVFQSLVYHPFFFIRKAHLDEELEPQLLEKMRVPFTLLWHKRNSYNPKIVWLRETLKQLYSNTL